MPPLPLHIFIVENHADTAMYMQMYFEQLGHSVEVAGDMQSALARLPAAKVDLLISDIGLPDGDGWELMRQLAPCRQIFAVAMSGFGMNADKARSKAVGYRHHLIKPFLPDELDSILEQAREDKPADGTAAAGARPN